MRTLPLRALTIASCVFIVASCGDNNKTTNNTAVPTSAPASAVIPAPTEVLRYETNGGCQMMGPNCATYVVYSDGTIEVYRTGENAPAEVVGAIDASEVTAFLDSVRNTDFDGLAAEVGPGTCNSCVDGIDTLLTLTLADGPIKLDSTVINFDLNNDFFANVETLIEDVRAVGELVVQQRG